MSAVNKVYVWSERKHDYVQTEVRRFKCPTCGTKYDPHNDYLLWWEFDQTNTPYLQCRCGEMYFTDVREEDYETDY